MSDMLKAYLACFGGGGSEDELLASARDVEVGPNGHIYVIDSTGQEIIELNKSGDLVAFFGSAQLKGPVALAIDYSGNIFVIDNYQLGSKTYCEIDVFNSAGALVRTFGEYGEDNGQLKHPQGIAVDSNGRVFVADTYNHRIAVFNTSGNFLRNLGRYGQEIVEFDQPKDVIVDSYGNLPFRA